MTIDRPERFERSPTLRRYAIAVLVAAAAFGATAMLEHEGVGSFAPFIGAIVVSCWYAGAGPGLATLVTAYAGAWIFLLADSTFPFDVTQRSWIARWLVSLAVSVIVICSSWALERAGRRVSVRAKTAEHERSVTEAVQHLAADLSSAATSSMIAHALGERLPGLLGANGAALALIDGDDLEIVDPVGAVRQTLAPGTRIPLSFRSLIAEAARQGTLVVADTRAQLESDYPDGAKIGPYANSGLGVPLRAGARVVGSMGFSFAESAAIDDEVVALARLAADLGGQALERAGLYEDERDSREMLDRISRLAPRFDTESPEAVLRTVCAEAIAMFGSDVAQVWAIDGDAFEVLWREPRSDTLAPGARVPLSDLPGRSLSIQRLETMFIEDSLTKVRGVALEHAQLFGLRSSLRVPIAVAGHAERVLVLQWTRIIPEPSAPELVLARRFADQAGLALGNAERRVAEAEATRNAEETRRLLDVTDSLAVALEPADVAETALREAFRALGASAGAVVRLDGNELELVASNGYADQIVEAWERFELDPHTPLGDSVIRNVVIALESPEDRAARYPAMAARATPHAAWLTLPLGVGGRVIGALGLSFDEERPFSQAERAFALALSQQVGQALERSTLLETEHAARLRAERMASDLAQLHALATALASAGLARDVTRIIGEQMVHGVGADTTAVYMLNAEGDSLALLAASGRLGADELTERISMGAQTPVTNAVRFARPVWLAGDELAAADPPAQVPSAGSAGIVPLVVEGTAIGALFVVFEQGHEPADDDRRFVETVARQAAQPLERVRLLEEERTSRVRAERATAQIRRLQAVTGSLSSALTQAEVVRVFLTQAAQAIGASAVAVGLVDERGAVSSESAWQGDRGHVPDSWLESLPTSRTPTRDAIAEGGAPLFFASADAVAAAYPELEPAPDTSRGPFAFVPLVAGTSPLAATVLSWPAGVVLGAEDRTFIEALSSQCGQALDRAHRYETERTIAETLQRSVLPETLSSMEGATVAARYLAGTAAVDVGGDWFDTIPMPNGRLGFVVGDVVGKGVTAAATMAQVRNGMRALTLDSSDPISIVSRLNRLLDTITDAPFATLVFVTIDPTTREASMLSAGHLPPLLLSPGRPPALLDGLPGLPLGVDPNAAYDVWHTTLEPGSTIVLYTDGLVERRDRSLDEGLRLLAEAVTGTDAGPDELVDLILERLIGDKDRRDDIALLAVGLDRDPLGTFSVRLSADPASLVELRREFSQWLARSGIPEPDRRDVMLATWETAANAIEHARDPSEPVIDVEATLRGDKVRVEVSDRGTWTKPRKRPDRGLGLHLIQSLMSSLSVEPSPAGTRVVMERALTRERAGDTGAHGGTVAADDHER